MQQVRVQPMDEQADPDAFRRTVRAEMPGDARPRPLDCTGERYLVRDDFLDHFHAAAADHHLAVCPDARRGMAAPGRPTPDAR